MSLTIKRTFRDKDGGDDTLSVTVYNGMLRGDISFAGRGQLDGGLVGGGDSFVITDIHDFKAWFDSAYRAAFPESGVVHTVTSGAYEPVASIAAIDRGSEGE